MAAISSRPSTQAFVRQPATFNGDAEAMGNPKSHCEPRHIRGSISCYLCIAYRMLLCKPLQRQRDYLIVARIGKISTVGIPVAIMICLLIGAAIVAQSIEIDRLHAALQAKALIEMSLAELSNLKVTRL